MKTILPVLFFTIFLIPFTSRAGSPPITDFSADKLVGCQTLTANFSDDIFIFPPYYISTYTWNFGDGTILVDTTNGYPSHTYLTPGIYDVTMSVKYTNGSSGSLTRNAYITVGSNFSVSLGPDTLTCVGKSILLDATTTNGSYLWSQASTTPSISTTASGQLSVIVSKDGCQAKDTVVITRNPLLTADFSYITAGGCSPIKTDFSQTSSACGGTIVSYAWDFGDDSTSTAANPTHYYASPGTYSVGLTVTKNDATTFNVTKSVIVTGFSTPVVELGPDQILCEGSTLTLSGGNAGADILWNTGETTSDITIWDGGIYSVVVTKDGCSAEDSIYITSTPEIILNFGFVKVGGCLPADIKFTDSTTTCSGAITDWLWNFGDGTTSALQNPLHTFTSKGQFAVRLTVTSSSGSTSSKTKRVIINPLDLSFNLGADTTICFGESVTLDAVNPGATYLWSTGESSQQVTVSDNGAYSVTVSLDGCTAKDTINVTTSVSVLSNFGYSAGGSCLPVAVSFSDSSTAFCSQSITSWKWTFGDGTTSTQRNPVHTYTSADSFNVKLLVTSSGGSSATRTKKVIVMNTPFTVDLPSELSVCRGGTVGLDAVITGAQYAWTPTYGLSAADVRNPTLTPSSNVMYKVVVTKCSITATDSVLITMDSKSKPVVVQDGNTLKSPDATTYQWYLEGNAIAGAVTKSIRVDKAGYYFVKVKNSTGCINQSDPYFYVPISGDDKTTDGVRIKVSPNPSNGVFNLLFSNIPVKPVIVTVYDAGGKLMMSKSVQDHVNRIDITGFSKGLYFVQLVINTKRRIIPVVVQ
jgi:PKD repeat protein